MRRATRLSTGILSAALAAISVVGCGNDTIPLADAPPIKQPEAVPLDKLTKEQRPPRFSSAAAALRFDPAKRRGMAPR